MVESNTRHGKCLFTKNRNKSFMSTTSIPCYITHEFHLLPKSNHPSLMTSGNFIGRLVINLPLFYEQVICHFPWEKENGFHRFDYMP
jgi:hypothetical protein